MVVFATARFRFRGEVPPETEVVGFEDFQPSRRWPRMRTAQGGDGVADDKQRAMKSNVNWPLWPTDRQQF